MSLRSYMKQPQQSVRDSRASPPTSSSYVVLTGQLERETRMAQRPSLHLDLLRRLPIGLIDQVKPNCRFGEVRGRLPG